MTLLHDAREILESYLAQPAIGWSRRAADDTRLRTDDLLRLALEEVISNRARELAAAMPALVVLHSRSDDETRLAALSLLASDNPASRELAALLMREFGPSSAGARLNAHEFLPALIRAVQIEHDTDALSAELSAIGWQCDPAAQSVLLAFARDQRASVRETVANQLRALSAVQRTLTQETAMALLELAHDRDADVASSVLYDVADTPEQFIAFREEFRQAAMQSLESEDTQLRETAQRAMLALDQLKEQP